MTVWPSESTHATAPPDRVTAAGVGRVGVELVAGASTLVESYATTPLRLLTPRTSIGRGRPAVPRIYVSGYGGGLVSGDTIDLDVTIGPGASALLTTQASTKAYHADASGRPARQRLRARVGAEGRLALLPDPVVCFADAVYGQDQTIDLAGGAGLVALDWLTAGRVASGERWALTRYASRTRVRLDGREVVHDALTLDAAVPGGARPFARDEAITVLASMWFVGSAAEGGRAWAERVKHQPMKRSAEVVSSVGVLAEGSAVVGRWAGGSVESVRSAMEPALAWLRDCWAIEPWARKW